MGELTTDEKNRKTDELFKPIFQQLSDVLPQLQAMGISNQEAFHRGAIHMLSLENKTVGGKSSGRVHPPSYYAQFLDIENNPDVLFEGDWLSKGCVGMLVAPSGAGKSVIALQLAYSWALGREIFGIKPKRPLKIAIFQDEDQPTDVAIFCDSMKRGYTQFFDWTEEDLKLIDKNVHFVDICGECDDQFFELIKEHQLEEMRLTQQPFDLILVNPLHSFTNRNISSNDDIKGFTRHGLNPLLKGYSPELPIKTAAFLIHHTSKPPTGPQRSGYGTDEYAQYVGNGASELMNWVRAELTLMPDKNDPHRYKLVAAKRGDRLKWKMPPKQGPKPMKILRHQDNLNVERDLLFWSEVPWGEVVPGWTEDTPAPERDPAIDAKKLAEEVRMTPLTASALRDKADKLFGDREYSREVADFIQENYEEYDLAVIRQKGGPGKLYCSFDDFEKLAALNEKKLLNFSKK